MDEEIMNENNELFVAPQRAISSTFTSKAQPFAPTYYPTMEEFSNFSKYVGKLESEIGYR